MPRSLTDPLTPGFFARKLAGLYVRFLKEYGARAAEDLLWELGGATDPDGAAGTDIKEMLLILDDYHKYIGGEGFPDLHWPVEAMPDLVGKESRAGSVMIQPGSGNIGEKWLGIDKDCNYSWFREWRFPAKASHYRPGWKHYRSLNKYLGVAGKAKPASYRRKLTREDFDFCPGPGREKATFIPLQRCRGNNIYIIRLGAERNLALNNVRKALRKEFLEVLGSPDAKDAIKGLIEELYE